jgi:hypothetical protein
VAKAVFAHEQSGAFKEYGLTLERGRHGRADVWIPASGADDEVAILQAKNTDWDQIARHNVRRNVRRPVRPPSVA